MSAILDYLFDLLILFVLSKLLNYAVRSLFRGHTVRFGFPGQVKPGGYQTTGEEPKTVEGKTVRDPVCGMFVSTDLSHRLTWHGSVLHFCSEACLQTYRKNAGRKA
jgi:YHS domain-containing protein